MGFQAMLGHRPQVAAAAFLNAGVRAGQAADDGNTPVSIFNEIGGRLVSARLVVGNDGIVLVGGSVGIYLNIE